MDLSHQVVSDKEMLEVTVVEDLMHHRDCQAVTVEVMMLEIQLAKTVTVWVVESEDIHQAFHH